MRSFLLFFAARDLLIVVAVLVPHSDSVQSIVGPGDHAERGPAVAFVAHRGGGTQLGVVMAGVIEEIADKLRV